MAIFLTIAAWPDSDTATSFVLTLRRMWSRRIASLTTRASTMEPPTKLSWGNGSTPAATKLYESPDRRSSTAFTALEPISSPTRLLFFRRSTARS